MLVFCCTLTKCHDYFMQLPNVSDWQIGERPYSAPRNLILVSYIQGKLKQLSQMSTSLLSKGDIPLLTSPNAHMAIGGAGCPLLPLSFVLAPALLDSFAELIQPGKRKRASEQLSVNLRFIDSVQALPNITSVLGSRRLCAQGQGEGGSPRCQQLASRSPQAVRGGLSSQA